MKSKIETIIFVKNSGIHYHILYLKLKTINNSINKFTMFTIEHRPISFLVDFIVLLL